MADNPNNICHVILSKKKVAENEQQKSQEIMQQEAAEEIVGNVDSLLLPQEILQLSSMLIRGKSFQGLARPTQDDILDVIGWARRIRKANAMLTIAINGEAMIDNENGIQVFWNEKGGD